MKKFLASIILCLSFQSYSMGVDAMLEFTYTLKGESYTGYIPGDYFYCDLDSLIGDDHAFQGYLEEVYKGSKTITVYGKIIEREELAGIASFPMHSYEVDLSSSQELELRKMKNKSLQKVWTRDAYGIKVLTPLSLSDKNWIGGESKHLNLGFDDVGCRLELFYFGDLDPKDPLLDKLYSFSPNDGSEMNLGSTKQLNILLETLTALKEKQIVVVELCGC